jgi:O-antigen ligase
MALFASLGVWTSFAAADATTSPWPVIELLLVVALAWWLGRLGGIVGPWVIPSVLIAVAAFVSLLSREELFSSAPLSGPFGYSNARSAFYVQAALAGVMLAAASRPFWLRAMGLAAAGFFAAVPLLTGSVAGTALLAVIAVALLGMVGYRRVIRIIPLLCGFLVTGVIALTVALAVLYRADAASSVISRAENVFTERRVTLWHEALVLIRINPVTGVGPGRFDETSPTARSDVDARWAHHEFLQFGAETGAPGLMLLVSLFLWGFARLWATELPDAVMAIGALSLAAVGIHASADYILHYPAVPVVCAALVGSAMAGGGIVVSARDAGS